MWSPRLALRLRDQPPRAVVRPLPWFTLTISSVAPQRHVSFWKPHSHSGRELSACCQMLAAAL